MTAAEYNHALIELYTPIHRGTSQKGPTFTSMTDASLWVFGRTDEAQWTIKQEGTAQAAAEMLTRGVQQ